MSRKKRSKSAAEASPAASDGKKRNREASLARPARPRPTVARPKHAATADAPGEPDVAERIRELEERLDRMIDEHSRDRAGSEALSPSSHPPPPASPATEGAMDTARDVSADAFLRKWGHPGLRARIDGSGSGAWSTDDIDEFGYDPLYEQKVLPFFNFLYEKYFRVGVQGIDRVPAEGRCLLVANHSGTVPFDGMMLRLAVRREHPSRREVRWLAEDAIFHLPFLGSFTNRLGAVRACPENAERLLENGALVAVFPEGMKGIGKLFKDRYRLQRFGRGGFVKLALRTRTPIVPVAIVGGEETNPMLARVENVTKALGIPYLPLTPTFPWLGAIGLVPAPTKWKILFGEAVDLEGYGVESAEDEILVGRLTERVRGAIQAILDHALSERRSVWFG